MPISIKKLNIYGALLKYGKAKGWTKIVPAFGSQS
jgi:hypothetical protein